MILQGGMPFSCQARWLQTAADWMQSRQITAQEWRRSRNWIDHWAGAAAWFLLTKVDPWLAGRQLRGLT